MKRVIFELKKSDDNPAAGLNIKAADCGDLDTNKDGLAIFLIDKDDVPVHVGGKEVAKLKLADIGEKVVLTEDGGNWKVG